MGNSLKIRIKLRRGTAAEWAAKNPVLADSEPGYESDTGKAKFGDGIRPWNSLPYENQEIDAVLGIVAGGSTATGTVSFANSNGISFGLNGSTLTASAAGGGGTAFSTGPVGGTDITGSLNSNGLSLGVPPYLTTAQPPGAYLTTAMQSNRGSDFVQATAAFAGTNASGTINSGGISVSVAAPGAGGGAALQGSGTFTQNTGTIQFSNSNGVSFGLTAGVMTATVATNYQSQGAYLTTAALSQDSSKYAGTNGAITGGSITVNTSGVSLNLPAYLTTAALSQDSSKYAGTSTGITGGSVTLNTSGIAINLPAYLTTADLSQNSSKYAGTSTGITGGSVTLNTSGIAINLPAYLTTADLSQNSSKYAGINSGATNCSVTVNTSGVSVNLPAYLTTAALSTLGIYASSNTYLTSSGTHDARSLSFRGDKSITIGISGSEVLFSVGAYLTTAALSQDSSKYAGTSTGITGGSVTLNTSGIAINLPAYLTTAALSQDSSKYAGTSTGITGGSVTLNTSGIAINLPAYLTTAMQSNAATISNVNISAGTTSTNASAFTFSNSGGVSFGIGTGASAGVITATVATVSVITLSAGTSSQTFGNVVFSNSNGISFGLNGSTVTAQGAFISYFNMCPFLFLNTVTSQFAQSTSYMIPFLLPEPISVGSVRLYEAGSVAASSTQGLVNGSTLSMSGQTSHNFVFYSRGVGASSMSLQYVTSTQVVDAVSFNVQNAAGANSSQLSYTYRFSLGNTSFTKDYSSTAQSYNFHTSNVTDLTGTKMVDYPCGLTLSFGQWFLAYGRSTTFATQNAVISVATRLNISYESQFIVSQNTLGALGTLGGASNSSVAFAPTGLGSFTTGGAAGTTNSLNISVISSGASNQIPIMQLIRIA
jgi:hypothetical protein